MEIQNKTRKELVSELQKLHQENDSLKALKEKEAAELIMANKELAFQNYEKEKRAAELAKANKELTIQNDEKEKRATELVIARENAEQSDRLKSSFLANMSREILTPMSGLLGFSKLFKKPDLSAKQRQKYAEIIEKSVACMPNIINDIVDISKIEAGLVKADLKDTNINERMEFIYTFFKPLVEGKRMQLFFRNTLPAKEAIIKSDSNKIDSILINLLKNAIKFSNEGAIEFGYILRTDSVPVCLEFYVKDTGIGIPKDRQKTIMERFIQAGITDTMVQEGAGLGLLITKAYVEMLGGKIWVESEEGEGSIFYFTLPYNTEPEEKNVVREVVPSESAVKQINNLKILIAEDDKSSKTLISIIVKEYSKEVIEARTGLEAVEVCRKNRDIDLILMDIQMPDLNGHEATRQIRRFNKKVVIIAQTAFGLSGDREKAIEAGCNDYIAKPINKAVLLPLIQKHFNFLLKGNTQPCV
jgi:signal transduction histidine kinase/ActR/RegA family two-component response regulator